MKKAFLFLWTALLLMGITGCGESGGGAQVDMHTTNVQITVGQPQPVSKAVEDISSAAQIPVGVAGIIFEISGAGMTTITRTVAISGQTTITESFDVPMGADRRFQVSCLNADGAVIYSGSTVVTVGALPLTLTIEMASTTYSISGTVYAGNTGEPGVTVRLFRSGLPAAAWIEMAQTATDTNGNYIFSGLTNNDYRVLIEYYGAAYTDSLDVTVAGASLAEVNFYLPR